MTKRSNSIVLQDEEQMAEILKRVKRAEGQIAGVIRMLEEGRSCEEVVHQMAAVGKAMNTAAKTNTPEQREKLQRLFLSLA
ncbi:MAG: Copper-sensing transcriptional repressor RicR [Actinomycetota bacterium]